MLTTRFTELVGCAVPIQSAGMASIASPALAAAVSEAGGLGMLGGALGGLTPAVLTDRLEQVRARTTRPFGVNFLASPAHLQAMDRRCFELAAQAARVVEFFYGAPDPALVEIIHAGGIGT